ncbi:hypothetical protein Hanom_Chr05g00415381 [Helianthus anomalus]
MNQCGIHPHYLYLFAVYNRFTRVTLYPKKRQRGREVMHIPNYLYQLSNIQANPFLQFYYLQTTYH